MKTIFVLEFDDLSEDVKKNVVGKMIEQEVEYKMHELTYDLEHNHISEVEYYEIIGCSKAYAESTSWFVPAYYYEKHKADVDAEVQRLVQSGLYTKGGKYILSQN